MGIFNDIKLYFELKKLIKEVKTNMIRDPKTTIWGILSGIALGLESYFHAHGVTLAGVISAIIPTVLGILASDSKSTNNSNNNPSNTSVSK
jgi:hypothetical protein